MDWIKTIDWKAWLATIALIILFREGAVWLMSQLDHPELGNLVGLIALLIVLVIWRKVHKIPARIVDTNNKIMKLPFSRLINHEVETKYLKVA